MFTKAHRLGGKQIQFLLNRGRKIYGTSFVMIALPQRHGRPQTQWSITIGLKVDKRATMRNMLKRYAKQIFATSYKTAGVVGAFQCFIFLNKSAIEPLKELIAKNDKTAILAYRDGLCKKDFQFFVSNIFAKRLS